MKIFNWQKKQISLCTWILILLLSGFGVPVCDGQDSLPNVILILADDLGYGDISCYNDKAAWTTPHIDKLASRGMRFTDAHTNASICTPTRYGILTGRYSWRSRLKRGGFNGFSRPLIDQERITIAELFKQKNYHTAFIGKWHLGWDWHVRDSLEDPIKDPNNPPIDFAKPIKQGPKDHGFDYSFALAASLSSPPYVFVENNLPTVVPNDISVNYDEKAFWRKGLRAPDFNHVDVLHKLTEKSVSYLKKRAEKDQPFFLYFSLTAPHAPIIPRSEFIGRSNANAYGDFVLQVDEVVGQITHTLEQTNLHTNTLILFISDNGQSPRADFDDDELPQAGHHGSYIFRGKKFDIYEGGHRVPFIASWPDHIIKGVTSEALVSTVDFFATCADLLNLNVPDNAGEDSYSMLTCLLDSSSSQAPREDLVMHSSDGRFAIRRGNWKLVLWPGSGGWAYPRTEEEMKGLPRFQLFDLEKDPSEKNNLINDHPDKAELLKELLIDYIKNGRSTTGRVQENDGPGNWPELEWMSN